MDQVSIRHAEDMFALDQLDQKLWVALAMPSKGIDIDAQTLSLLDHDGDTRIRVEDVLAAITWAKTTFAKPSDLLASKDAIELSAIADGKIVAAAKRMLGDLGKPSATSISVADSVAIGEAFAQTVLNGDAIVIPASATDADVRHAIEDAIACVGSATDRSGKPGIDQAIADQLFAEADTRAAWLARGKDPALAPLGAATAAAADATAAVRAKIEDFFTRCRIAAYDPRGTEALAPREPELVAIGAHVLDGGDPQLAALPLAAIETKPKLPLDAKINPAWADRIAAFAASAVQPIVGKRDTLTPDELRSIVERLAPYQAWLDSRPVTKVDGLDAAWLERLAGPELRDKVRELIAADAALSDEYAQISAVAKTVRMQRDFGRVLRNFVNFSDFYSRQDGVFQAGTLYLDARAFHLCIPVVDVAKHAALAGASDACLMYCDLARGGATQQVAVALTNGDLDNVFVGRNGIFYDREGKDWDATVVKVVPNPISIRAAFWSPYKWLVKAIEDNVAKRARAAEAASAAKVESTGSDIANADKNALAEAAATPAPPPKPDTPPAAKPIDLGTIAAIGVAIGGIGTLFGALLANLFGLGMWMPVGLVAVLMLISGPSMLLAWLKLRRRNLGPILDANGWAINGRARINVSFGAAMTELARLPSGAKRSLDDPFADKRTPWRRWVFLIVVLGLAGAWYVGKLDRYLPQNLTSVEVMGSSAPAYKAKP